MNIHWFRRDLRLQDNAALYNALKEGNTLPLFIFDTNILDKLADKADARVTFIHETVMALKAELETMGSSLIIKYGKAEDVWLSLTEEYKITNVFTNHDYEPYAISRDTELRTIFEAKNITFSTYKDQCIFEKNEVLTDQGKPYTVFTPYKNKWLKTWKPFYTKPYPTAKYFNNFHKTKALPVITLGEMGFTKSTITFPSAESNEAIIAKYTQNRDFPAIKGTSRLSVHLRFGTVSIRQLATQAQALNDTWLSELIWRDFYFQILWHYPHCVNGAFRPAYNAIPWRNNEAEYERWKNGQTGYPIVDAGMRELNATGFMHNRVRMIVASFLTKHLLIDWRWGEAYFAEKLLDFDLSANNGGWQWAAGSGCDASPYFRIFNPAEQTKKFDNQLLYIRKWVPEFQSMQYVKPIVEHTFARNRCLVAYKSVLKPE